MAEMIPRSDGDEERKVSASESLCDELIFKIFIQVPPKTVFRSKCVCKSWKTMFSDKSFLKRAKAIPLPPLIVGFFSSNLDRKDKRIDFYEIISNSAQVVMDTRFRFLQEPIIVVSSHDGLVLCEKMKDGGGGGYIVCNPLTHQLVNLPRPKWKINLAPQFYMKCMDLFCYNKTSDEVQFDFTVVSLLIVDSNDFLIEIYSSETGEWTSIRKIPCDFPNFKPTTIRLFSYESFYLLDIDYRQLCIYNWKEKTSHFIALPIVVGADNIQTRTGVLGLSSESLLYYAEKSSFLLNVWVLVEGVKWSLIQRIRNNILKDQFPGTRKERYELRLLCFHPTNCNIVLVRFGLGGDVFLYHIDDGQVELLKDSAQRVLDKAVPYSLPAWPPCIRKN
ncbi:hypothetical protein ACHQM5_010517 [Ranunculus cassubicifolius]